MSSQPLTQGQTTGGWARPFTIAYANQTFNFLAAQILLWSRLLSLTGTNILVVCDIATGVSILTGVILGIPYVISAFRSSEIVVDGGPSLVRDIIPEWITSASLLTATLALLFADIATSSDSTPIFAWLIYVFIGLVGLTLSTLSKSSQKERLLVSVTFLLIYLNCKPNDSFIHPPQFIIPLSLVVSYLFDAYEVQQTRDLLHAKELLIFRLRMILKLFLALVLLISWLNIISRYLVVSLFASRLALYFFERKLGSIESRTYSRLLPPRPVLFQVVD
jgi:hypothetical protein